MHYSELLGQLPIQSRYTSIPIHCSFFIPYITTRTQSPQEQWKYIYQSNLFHNSVLLSYSKCYSYSTSQRPINRIIINSRIYQFRIQLFSSDKENRFVPRPKYLYLLRQSILFLISYSIAKFNVLQPKIRTIPQPKTGINEIIITFRSSKTRISSIRVIFGMPSV